jgi:hypothetical protein
MIMMIIVVKNITSPLLNKFLQKTELCEVAIGVGQSAAHFRIVVKIPTHK